MAHGPFQRLLPTNRATRYQRQLTYPQMLDQLALRMHHIADRDNRKAHSVSAPCTWVERRWAGRAVTTAQDVRADHKVARRINRTAWPDQWIPPRYFHVIRLLGIMCMRIPRAGVRDQNGVIAFGIEGSPRFVCQGDGS